MAISTDSETASLRQELEARAEAEVAKLKEDNAEIVARLKAALKAYEEEKLQVGHRLLACTNPHLHTHTTPVCVPHMQIIADHAADLAIAQEETLARTTELNKVLAVASKERAKRVELESDLNTSRWASDIRHKLLSYG